MLYKDKEKQKEANRQAKQRQRRGMTQQGMTKANNVIPDIAPKVQHFNPMMAGYVPVPKQD